MERKTETRRLTPAERHANRALGRPDVTEVEVETTSAADLIAAQVRDRGVRPSRKPAGTSTSAWYGQRVRERNAAERAAQAAAWGAEEDEEETETEEERVAGGSWGAGRRVMRTDNGAIVG